MLLKTNKSIILILIPKVCPQYRKFNFSAIQSFSEWIAFIRIFCVRHLTFFSTSAYFVNVVTLSLCLTGQIIRFILPPNEYGCAYAWKTLVNTATLLWKTGYVAEYVRKLHIFGFWKKRSTVSFVCSLSCEISETNWHPHQ